jgi:hypothetical protein
LLDMLTSQPKTQEMGLCKIDFGSWQPLLDASKE